MNEENPNVEAIKTRTIDMYRRISPLLIDAVGEAAKVIEKEYKDVPTIMGMVAIHASLMLMVESSRGALEDILGGKPVGEARARVIEENLRKTVLKGSDSWVDLYNAEPEGSC